MHTPPPRPERPDTPTPGWPTPHSPLRLEDLSGCRYRSVLRRNADARSSTWQDWWDQRSHRALTAARRAALATWLPTQPRRGDRVTLNRVDIAPGPTAAEDTLEAVAAGTRLILNPRLDGVGGFTVDVDLLVRVDDGLGACDHETRYVPFIISGYGIARRARSAAQADCRVVDVRSLGLSTPVAPREGLRHRTAGGDAQRLGMATVVLDRWGVGAGEVGLIGRLSASTRDDGAAGAPASAGAGARGGAGEGALDRVLGVVFPAASSVQALGSALSVPVPRGPHRVRECEGCSFRVHCRAQLLAEGHVSLMVPGGPGRELVEEGITTVAELAEADRGELSLRAAAWLRGVTVLRRPEAQWAQRVRQLGLVTMPASARGQVSEHEGVGVVVRGTLDVEVDMEAHPDRGTVLWGVGRDGAYRAFRDYSAGGDEGRHVAELWAHVRELEAEARGRGEELRVWVYAAQGETHWLRYYARRFGGRVYADAGMRAGAGAGAGLGAGVRMPTLEEVNAFIASPAYCDLFSVVSTMLVASESLGLKAVAPLAGFQFTQEGVDGRVAVDLVERATATGAGVGSGGAYADFDAPAAQAVLERYNRDDCEATRAVRRWLERGAPGVEELA